MSNQRSIKGNSLVSSGTSDITTSIIELQAGLNENDTSIMDINTAIATLTSGKENKSEKNTTNGYAGLIARGHS